MPGFNHTVAIIPAYNGSRWIAACLSSLEQAGCSHCIVVDNASTDSTVDIIKRDFPKVTLIALDENVGFGMANNIGIQSAIDEGASRVLSVNQDTILQPSTIVALEQALAQNPDYGFLTPLALDYEGEKLDPIFALYSGSDYFNDLVFNEVKPVYSVDFIPACLVLFNVEALKEVGGFDPLFFMYSEDKDLCDRMRSAGWKVGFVPASKVQHWDGLINRPRSLSSIMVFDYGERVLGLKELHRLGYWPALLLKLKGWRQCGTQTALGLISFLRTLPRMSKIRRHAKGNPYKFS